MRRLKNMIRENLKMLMGIRIQARQVVTAVLLFALPLLAGCPTKKQVLAEAWLHEQIDKPLSDPICDYGIHRKLNDDECEKLGTKPPCEEFISYCRPEVSHYISFKDTKLQEWLNQMADE